jgi:hypothetical protein
VLPTYARQMGRNVHARLVLSEGHRNRVVRDFDSVHHVPSTAVDRRGRDLRNRKQGSGCSDCERSVEIDILTCAGLVTVFSRSHGLFAR